LCGGIACGAGASCITWYYDKDGDGYGASGPVDKLSCSNVAPPQINGKSFRTNKSDCFDGNANAFPGQTKYFTTHRGDGSFDYDCNVALSYEVPVSTVVACKDCGYPGVFGCTNCSGTSMAMGLECNSTWGGCSGVKVKSAFDKVTACGQMGTYRSCDDACQSIPYTTTRAQGCR
jgi:hypothetical protein